MTFALIHYGSVAAQSIMFQNKTKVQPPLITPSFEIPEAPEIYLTEDARRNFAVPGKDVSCVPTDADIDRILKATDVSECFAKRNVSSSKLLDKYLQDGIVCDCLDEKANVMPHIKKVMENSVTNMRGTDEEKITKKIKNDTAKKWQDLQKKRIGLSFDASVNLSGEHARAMKNNFALELFDNTRKVLRSKSESTRYQIQKVVEDLTQKKGIRLIDPKFLKVVQKESEIQIQNQPDVNNLFTDDRDDRTEANQCIGVREYNAFKQFPNGNVVFQELQKDFKPAEWNFNTLRTEYDSIMNRPLEERHNKAERITVLKEKIKFLNKNPMIKSFFAMPTDKSEYDTYFLMTQVSEKEKNKKLSLLSESTLGKKRAELFQIMKNFAAGQSCEKGQDKCLISALQKKNNLSHYKNSLKAFFGDKTGTVQELTKLGDGHQYAQGIINLYNTREKEKSIEAHNDSQLPSQENLAEHIYNETGLDPASCNGSSDQIKCAEAFGLYCPKVRKAATAITVNQHYPEVVDDLDQQIKYDLEPEFNKNNELKSLNEYICNTRHQRNSNEEGMTFFDYRKETCDSINISFENCRYNYIKEFKLDGPYKAFGLYTASEYRPKNYTKEQTVSMTTPESRTFFGEAHPTDWGLMHQNLSIPDSHPDIFQLASVQLPESREESLSVPGASNIEAPQTGSEPTTFASPYNPGSEPTTFSSPYGPTTPYFAPVGETKIEELSDQKKKEMLAEAKQDYNDFKYKHSGEVNTNPVVAAQDDALKAKISALEQALADQRKLTEDQRDLLNRAIAEKSNVEDSPVVLKKKNTTAQGVAANQEEIQTQVPVEKPVKAVTPGPSRSIASLKSGNPKIDSSDVAREEAKLVGLRNGSNGAIIIENIGKSNLSRANAIAITLSDEQYRLIQSNPNAVNLSQLEKNIPQEQIDRLEKTGQIILLLQNGSNPPFEVKVERKNKRLVLSRINKEGKPQEPVRRIHTLSGLGGTIQQAVKK